MTTNTTPKRPDVVVQLTGNDGNAFAIIGRVNDALRAAGYAGDIEDFSAEAMAGDYDHLLRTCMSWVVVA